MKYAGLDVQQLTKVFQGNYALLRPPPTKRRWPERPAPGGDLPRTQRTYAETLLHREHIRIGRIDHHAHRFGRHTAFAQQRGGLEAAVLGRALEVHPGL